MISVIFPMLSTGSKNTQSICRIETREENTIIEYANIRKLYHPTTKFLPCFIIKEISKIRALIKKPGIVKNANVAKYNNNIPYKGT